MQRIKNKTSNCKERNQIQRNVKAFLSPAFQVFSPERNTDRFMGIIPERFYSITSVCVCMNLCQSVSYYPQYSLSSFLVNLITNLRNLSSSK